jgi:hypothetical protein
MRILFAAAACAACLMAEVKLGKPLTVREATPIASLAATPEQFVDKVVQAKGKVTEVCQKMGCWMMLVDENGKAVRIKVKDGEMVFPKDSVGKTAVAEGKFVGIQLTKEQTIAQRKHEAEENGKKFDPASVTAATVIYQISGRGALIQD